MGGALSTTAVALANEGDYTEQVQRILAIKKLYPENRATKHFDFDYFKSLSADQQQHLMRIVKSGVGNPDSSMGCYAMAPDDYTTYKPFFANVCADYHGVPVGTKHVNDWSLAGVEGLPESGVLDIAELGLPELSMRVRVGRNLADFPLPGNMTQDDRTNLELKMCEAFKVLAGMEEYGGGYHSLTPGHENFIDEAAYNELVAQHIMFKDMSEDSFLLYAGISGNWPFGRGCYVSEDKGFIIWVGEEDHLRIMCMKKGTILNDIFNRLENALKAVGEIDGINFARDEEMGFVTSCPTNLGTAMRASLHIALPKLCGDGTDTKAKAIAKPLGLSVRGTGGEHTPIVGGVVDISPSARFAITEAQVITALYLGIKLLKAADDEA
jgi:protein-arginine kinase